MAKKAKNENFPVGSFLIEKHLRQQVGDFYNFARFCDDIADNSLLSCDEKLKLLNEQKTDNKHLQKLLKAFRQDAVGFEYKTWQDLLDYCSLSAAPVGQFMLDLHNEKTNADNLCAALQIVNHIQDIKYDAEVLSRIYMPLEMMKKHNVKSSDLKQKKSDQNLKNMINEMLEKVKHLIKDVPDIRSKRLKKEVAVIISLTNSMICKLAREDVLEKRVRLSKLEWIKAFATGVLK